MNNPLNFLKVLTIFTNSNIIAITIIAFSNLVTGWDQSCFFTGHSDNHVPSNDVRHVHFRCPSQKDRHNFRWDRSSEQRKDFIGTHSRSLGSVGIFLNSSLSFLYGILYPLEMTINVPPQPINQS